MPVFQLNEPIETDEPVVEVDALPRIGRYIFELVVVDGQGERSAPVRATVTVRRAVGPPGDVQAGVASQKAPRSRKPAAPTESPAEPAAEKPKRARKPK